MCRKWKSNAGGLSRLHRSWPLGRPRHSTELAGDRRWQFPELDTTPPAPARTWWAATVRINFSGKHLKQVIAQRRLCILTVWLPLTKQKPCQGEEKCVRNTLWLNISLSMCVLASTTWGKSTKNQMTLLLLGCGASVSHCGPFCVPEFLFIAHYY